MRERAELVPSASTVLRDMRQGGGDCSLGGSNAIAESCGKVGEHCGTVSSRSNRRTEGTDRSNSEQWVPDRDCYVLVGPGDHYFLLGLGWLVLDLHHLPIAQPLLDMHHFGCECHQACVPTENTVSVDIASHLYVTHSHCTEHTEKPPAACFWPTHFGTKHP